MADMAYRVSSLVKKIIEAHCVDPYDVFSCYVYLVLPKVTVPAYQGHTRSTLEDTVRVLLGCFDSGPARFGRIVDHRQHEVYRNYARK